MGTILTAITPSTTARPVLCNAGALARLFGADLDVVHVGDDHLPELCRLTDWAGVRLRVLHGPVIRALRGELSRPRVQLGVLGCRDGPPAATAVGHVARALVEHAAKPVVVVSPGAPSTASISLTHALVPLDGSPAAASAVEGVIELLAGSGVDITVLHVFDDRQPPAFFDQAAHALEAWGQEFLHRHARPDLQLHLRVGPPGGHVLAVAADLGVDLIAVGWSQDLSPGHATVVRELLARATVPVLLLPVAPLTTDDTRPHGGRITADPASVSRSPNR